MKTQNTRFKSIIRNATFIVALVLLPFMARADLIITEVMSSSSHSNTQANGDWWELYNSGSLAVDLTGYSWDDDSATAGSADFNGITIGAGQAIIICQETIGAEQSWLDLWGLTGVTVVNLGNTKFQNLGSGGDAVHLYDPFSVEIASVSFGAASTGYSFAWDANGVYLGLSELSVDGAFQATADAGGGPDVASPGFVYIAAVPEPGTVTLLVLGSLTLLARCRRVR